MFMLAPLMWVWLGLGTLPFEAIANDGLPASAALIVADVRDLEAQAARLRTALRHTPAGQALLADSVAQAALPLAELLRAALPAGKAVPAALVLHGTGTQAYPTAALCVSADFVERHRDKQLGAYQLMQRPPAAGQAPIIDFVPHDGGPTYVGVRQSNGFLRLARHDAQLQGSGTAQVPLIPAPIVAAAQSEQAVLWLAQGSDLWRGALAAWGGDGALWQLLAQATDVAWGLDYDRDKTVRLRLLLQGPFVQALATGLGAPPGSCTIAAPQAHTDTTLEALDKQAFSYASVYAAPLLQAALPALFSRMPAAAVSREDVAKVLAHLVGRISFMGFDAPGDWALALQLDDPAAAAAMLPHPQGLARTMTGYASPGSPATCELEPFFPLTGQVLHLRPDSAVQGPYVAALGSTLVLVQERTRLQRLAALLPHRTRAAPGTLLDGPLTPMMRRALQPGHLLQVYGVLGGDGSLLEYALWGARGVLQRQNVLGGAAGVEAAWRDLPRLLAVFADGWLWAYDAALSLDITGGLLDICCTASGV